MFTGIRTHVPTCQKVTRLLLSYRGDRQECPREILSSQYSMLHFVGGDAPPDEQRAVAKANHVRKP